jgi:acyl carrier protein
MERSELLERVKQLATETLEVDPDTVTESASFADDLEADSLDLVELVMAIEEEFDISIPEEELEGIETVGQALSLVEEKIAAKA